MPLEAHPPYDELAAEYYDEFHKTCRNFDVATAEALKTTRAPTLQHTGLVLEVGAGRGRCSGLLGVPSERVVQLDSSSKMLELEPREPCMLRVLADATQLPFLDGQFNAVCAFLCDPYIGLGFLAEARRVLVRGGFLVATLPSAAWGHPLRKHLSLPLDETRFFKKAGGEVRVPSRLIEHDQLRAMLAQSGFVSIELTSHRLPLGNVVISDDIKRVAKEPHSLDIIDLVRAVGE